MPRASHIAVFTVPAHGHVNPSLAIVRELVERGHRVSYVITEEFAAQVAATGADVVPYETTWPTTAEGKRTQWSDDLVEIWTQFLDESIHALPQAAAAFAGDVPDLLLYDIGAYEARVLAHRWHRPIVQLSPAYVAWDGYEEEMAAMFDPVKATPEYAAYERRFLDWLAVDGIALGVDEFVGRPARSLVLIPRAMQPNADRVPDAYTFVGPCVDPRADEGTWEGPGDGRRVLLISLGSAYTDRPEFFRACVEAFGDGDWHVVLSIGEHVDPAVLGSEPPANVEVHRFVPQVAVLERASAFVTHAGMGSTKEGLAAGVPLVAVPQGADQFANAQRIAELGVGVHLPAEEATASALRAAVGQVADDPAVAARLAQVREEVAAEGGTRAAADLIEGLLPEPRD